MTLAVAKSLKDLGIFGVPLGRFKMELFAVSQNLRAKLKLEKNCNFKVRTRWRD